MSCVNQWLLKEKGNMGLLHRSAEQKIYSLEKYYRLPEDGVQDSQGGEKDTQ